MVENISARLVRLPREIACARTDEPLPGRDGGHVTQRFHKEFQAQHIEFAQAITGIADERARRRYASVLLNRLLFIHFLQRQGFIKGHAAPGGDYEYLQRNLAARRKAGRDQYYSVFLRALFCKGFAKPQAERTSKERRLLGAVPYLNGELFLPHAIEQRNPDIRVPDAAFASLYAFFGKYSWNLDDTPGGQADEINPDVLGYIFEKYINQKAFGAYYTPPEITQHLCAQTIHKLILDRVNALAAAERFTTETQSRHIAHGEENSVDAVGLRRVSAVHAATDALNPRRYESIQDLLLNLDAFLCRRLLDEVLPDLKLLDPACGSGAFLVAAMQTLLNVYAAVIGQVEFLGDRHLQACVEKWRAEHKSLNYFLKQRIITDNLFGVDIMAEATEVVQLRLYLALGASAQGAEQFEPPPHIDFNIRAGNALIGLLHVNDTDYDERHGQGDMLRPTYKDVVAEKNRLIEQYRNYKENSLPGGLEALRDQISAKKQETLTALNGILLREFTKLGIKYEQATWDEAKNKAGKPQKRAVALKDIEALQPFHWGYEFDRILNQHGGFDAIITNPPWEIFKPQAKEFFAEHSAFVTKNKMTIKEFEKEQAKLLAKKDVRAAWLAYQERFPHVSLYFRNSPQYKNQISIVNGKKAGTDINLYKLFVEQCFNLLRPGGECGLVIPSGIYTDLGTKQLREMLFGASEVTGLFGFENRKFIFAGVDSRFKFVVLTFKKGSSTETFPAAFMRQQVEELAQFPRDGALRIRVDLIRRLSPASLSVLEFKHDADVRIAEKMIRFPPLGRQEDDKWNLALTSEFHLTNDSYLFKTVPGTGRLPLYEGKMIHQFTHLLAAPRYWVDEQEARQALRGRSRRGRGEMLDYQTYRLGFRAIARNTDNRTIIVGPIPRNVFCGNSMLVCANNNSSACATPEAELLLMQALLNSVTVDYYARQMVSANINMFYIYQLPVPRLTAADPAFAPIVARAARLVCITPEFADLARSVGLRDHTAGATDPATRARLRAELDGMIAHLYGLTEEEFAHILATFPLVAPETKDAALAEFRQAPAHVR